MLTATANTWVISAGRDCILFAAGNEREVADRCVSKPCADERKPARPYKNATRKENKTSIVAVVKRNCVLGPKGERRQGTKDKLKSNPKLAQTKLKPTIETHDVERVDEHANQRANSSNGKREKKKKKKKQNRRQNTQPDTNKNRNPKTRKRQLEECKTQKKQKKN